MTEVDGTVLGWLVPALVVFGTAALLILITVWLVRRDPAVAEGASRRRSDPRQRRRGAGPPRR